ncbi:DUF1508 domain-containing protein [Halomicroarcula sp. F13]|uniref:DUF1508 domain-containing protein n=1 Tax=Haloarcula rubra TaxID=2487747 RepID=A0AAW4PLK5_9EURY|nr:HVO_2922 family protein [Halomicroarcula rubra]MBX0321918.1 DUF1508 domain-containing protein [Halomicroarcula rubra]
MSPSDEYEVELTTTRAEAAALLTGVADGVREGTVRLGDGPEAVTVDTPAELTVELEVEMDDDGVSLEVELEWPNPAAGARDAVDADGEDDTAASPSDGRSAASVDEGTDGATVERAESPDATDGDGVAVGAAGGTGSLARFELFRDRADEWRWRLRHRNGNVIATSGEGYTRKHNARKGMRSVVENAPGAEVRADGPD